MTRPGASCLVLALLCVTWPCLSLAADAQARFLHPDDRVVFLGDSITFQGIYTKKIEHLVDEALGDGNVTFVNAGLGSDRATNGLRRFEKDVLAHDPTVVVFCFGMNDAVVRTPNAPVNDAALAAFLDSHRQMVRICQENGIRPFILSSSPARPDLIVPRRRAASVTGSPRRPHSSPMTSRLSLRRWAPRAASMPCGSVVS